MKWLTNLSKSLCDDVTSLVFAGFITANGTSFLSSSYVNLAWKPSRDVYFGVESVNIATGVATSFSNVLRIAFDPPLYFTFKRSDGIIVMYDPTDDESARYAVGVINEAPDEVPILVIANFLDTRKYEPAVHELMEFVSTRIVHIQASSLGMRGLSSVASWLDEPLIYHRKMMFHTLAEHIQKEMATLRDDLRNLSATVDADLYDARPVDDADVIDDAIPLEFRVDATENEFEPRRADKGSAMKIRLEGL